MRKNVVLMSMLPAAGLFAVLAITVTSAMGQDKTGEDQPIPEFSEQFLSDPEEIALGEEIWQEQCTHCHGSKAYPGKAPKLRPSRYKPEFVYHRVTYGFRGMPPWEEVYDEHERMAVTAYIKSKQFSP